jgi:hypothetical protein
LHILSDKNVPVGVRRFLSGHDVRTFVEMQWHPQLDNGKLLTEAEAAGFDVLVTSDQNIRYQQNLIGRKLALVVLGSNIWPVVRDYEAAIRAKVATAKPDRDETSRVTSTPQERSQSQHSPAEDADLELNPPSTCSGLLKGSPFRPSTGAQFQELKLH